jgi:hypothetical protein
MYRYIGVPYVGGFNGESSVQDKVRFFKTNAEASIYESQLNDVKYRNSPYCVNVINLVKPCTNPCYVCIGFYTSDDVLDHEFGEIDIESIKRLFASETEAIIEFERQKAEASHDVIVVFTISQDGYLDQVIMSYERVSSDDDSCT